MYFGSSFRLHHFNCAIRQFFTGLLYISLLGISACSAIPDSGPTERGVMNAQKNPAHNPLQFQILPVTPQVATILASEVPPLISSLDRTDNPIAHNDRIGSGDVLSITVFELGAGLFSTRNSGSSTGSASSLGPAVGVTNQNLPPTQVEVDGTISIPYIGRMRAAGLTPQTLSENIRKKLLNKSQNP